MRTEKLPHSADPVDFAPPLLRIVDKPLPPLAGRMLWLLIALVAGLVLLATFGRLDVVAVAEGKLIPSGYLQIVQPPEQGVVKEILVREGQAVSAGEILVRMDPVMAQADVKALEAEFHAKRIALRRIDAQLEGRPLSRGNGDPAEVYSRAEAQHRANIAAYDSAIAQEKSLLEKARNDLAAARETKSKLEQVLPHYREQEAAFGKLARDGFAGRVMATDKTRERIEREQDLRAQEFVIRSNLSLLEQSERKIGQITADYQRQLRAERYEIAAQHEKVRHDLAKMEHRSKLLALKAPVDGIVKDLATHTVGTVAAPGTILMTIVPKGELLLAEVWLGNQDSGFVRVGQKTKLKLVPFQFQKYGLIEGAVEHIGADASEPPGASSRADAAAGRERLAGPLAFRTLVKPQTRVLEMDGQRYTLAPGMQVTAEFNLGTRSVLDYLLSPVQRAFHDAGRER